MIYCAIIAFFLCFVFIFYISRHSWASIARSRNIPLSVISQGMGHDSESTTKIYLASLETNVIDRANQTLIKLLEGN